MIQRVAGILGVWRSQWRKILRCFSGFFATSQCARSFKCARKVLRWFPWIEKFRGCTALRIYILGYYFNFAFLDTPFISHLTSGLHFIATPAMYKSCWDPFWEDSQLLTTTVWHSGFQKFSFACMLNSSGILDLSFEALVSNKVHKTQYNYSSFGLRLELQTGRDFWLKLVGPWFLKLDVHV